MRSAFLALMVGLAVLASESRARACTCLFPDLARSYRTSDHVVHVRVFGVARRSATFVFYDAVLVEDAFKGCLNSGARVLIRTPSDSGACGTTLARGEYLIHGDAVAGRLPTLSTTLCDANSPWRALGKEDLAFLYSRLNCCNGVCACTDGTEPVNCFVDPCEVSTCDVKGAVCEANYCGGCNAEWYDPTGARVCTEARPCPSSAACEAGEYCTTEDGVCNRPPGCDPGEICPAVCYGECAPAAR